MCFGTAGYRTFPNATGPSVESDPNMTLQPSATAPTTEAGVNALPQAKPSLPLPPVRPAPPRAPRVGIGGNRYPTPVNPRLYAPY